VQIHFLNSKNNWKFFYSLDFVKSKWSPTEYTGCPEVKGLLSNINTDIGSHLGEPVLRSNEKMLYVIVRYNNPHVVWIYDKGPNYSTTTKAMTIFDYWKNYCYCLRRFSSNNFDLRLWWQNSLSEKILKEIFDDVQENLCIFFFEKNYILNCFISIFHNTDRFWIKKKTELKLVVWFKKMKHYTTLSFRDNWAKCRMTLFS